MVRFIYFLMTEGQSKEYVKAVNDWVFELDKDEPERLTLAERAALMRE